MSVHDRTHAMIDWETLDTKPSAVVLTLGAVKFNPYRGIVGSKFYRRWTLASTQRLGLTMSPDTLSWWMTQSDAARREAFEGKDDLRQSIHEFGGWYVGCRGIWGHGSVFDIAIMDNVHRALGIVIPYRYDEIFDTRTSYLMSEVKVDRATGTHHVAVDDAVQQAIAVCEAYRKLGLAPFVGKVKLEWEEAKIEDHVPTTSIPSDVSSAMIEANKEFQRQQDRTNVHMKVSDPTVRY